MSQAAPADGDPEPIHYGEIHWVKPDPSVGSEQAGRRPVLVVSADEPLSIIETVVTTVPLTTVERGWATHIEVSGSATGLLAPSWAICEQVRTIARRRVAGRIGVASAQTMAEISAVLRYLLNL